MKVMVVLLFQYRKTVMNFHFPFLSSQAWEADSGRVSPWVPDRKNKGVGNEYFLLTVLLEVSHHLLELFFRDFSSRVPLLQYLRWPSPVVPIPAVAPAPPPPPEEEAEDEEDDEEEENEAEREEEEAEGEEPVVRVPDGRRR